MKKTNAIYQLDRYCPRAVAVGKEPVTIYYNHLKELMAGYTKKKVRGHREKMENGETQRT